MRAKPIRRVAVDGCSEQHRCFWAGKPRHRVERREVKLHMEGTVGARVRRITRGLYPGARTH